MKNINMLVIGGLPNKEKKLGYGGATVLMQNFVDFLEQNHYKYKFIQTNKYFKKDGKPNNLKNIIYFFILFLKNINSTKCIMFNFSDHAVVFLYPILVKITKLLKKKVVLRKFGGSLDIYIENVPIKKKDKVFNAINMTDLIFLETKKSINHISEHIEHSNRVKWFPNVRNSSLLHAGIKYQKRFVFISHILDDKGVGNILDVAKNLPKDYVIDLYGPIKETKYENYPWSNMNVNYKGTLTSSEVLKTLVKYNILLLPTNYREGYPGIVIEAMSVGIPSITTYVGGIPEIITNKHNGILIDPLNTKQLEEAILSINQENYKKYSENALKTFNESFNSETTNNQILDQINHLIYM